MAATFRLKIFAYSEGWIINLTFYTSSLTQLWRKLGFLSNCSVQSNLSTDVMWTVQLNVSIIEYCILLPFCFLVLPLPEDTVVFGSLWDVLEDFSSFRFFPLDFSVLLQTSGDLNLQISPLMCLHGAVSVNRIFSMSCLFVYMKCGALKSVDGSNGKAVNRNRCTNIM